ncbi:Protein of unknown function [Amycolatopsis marina]|uniref:DUF3558 domain-containing protein n=1 Tax=Amycolatopsis marina TaxID=490629 RepID=A0A1I0VIF7_9PSEU|nr:DUF3558 domain-containing protein [Amycolatopsis marina]SFA76154.1 Protein of unknown function [Amycolatopsis marina]
MTGATPARNQVLLMVVLLGLSGCGSTEPGRAVPVPDGTGPSEPFQRPQELSLDDVDPCSLLSSAQLDELGVNSRPREAGRACSFDVDRTRPYYSHVLETITDADLHAWIDGEYASTTVRARTGEVAGYPSVTRYRDRGTPADCEILVGVAQGQTLRSQLYPITRDAFDQQELCALSAKAATLALRTLRAKG